jgi:hypothetical protein
MYRSGPMGMGLSLTGAMAGASAPERLLRLAGVRPGRPDRHVGRRFAEKLGAQFGQPAVVVENRTGASSSVGGCQPALSGTR